jgi:MoxR-like ATPase
MSWSQVYRGDGNTREVTLPAPPPWRTFPRPSLGKIFQPPAGLADAVNAALCLRRPMLITGAAGSGKSTVIESVAEELNLGPVLRWHITSRSNLADALYRYDVLGRIHAQQLQQSVDDIAPFLQLGPLGTALMPAKRPRALLIDEIDKSDLDLPSDLLEVLERGEFEIPELARYEKANVSVREWESDQHQEIARGRIRCAEFPFIVMTSNGERDFPAPFLRRCVRYTMPPLTSLGISQVVQAHLGQHPDSDEQLNELVHQFLDRAQRGEHLAIDQLLNAAFLLTGQTGPTGEHRARLTEQLLRELTRA